MNVVWATLQASLNATCRDRFGEPITSYTRGAVTLPALQAIFDTRPSAESVASGDVPVNATAPRLDILHGDMGALSAPLEGDTFTARGQAYRVESVEAGTPGRSVCHCTEVD